MHESFWWWQCSDRYTISIFPPPPYSLPPFSPSLIILMVSVDVKHHVYLRCRYRQMLLSRRKRTLDWEDQRHIPRTIESHTLIKKIWTHAPRRIIVNTDGEEGTEKSRIGRGQWVTNVSCYRSKLLLFETFKAVVMQCPIGFDFLTSRASKQW